MKRSLPPLLSAAALAALTALAGCTSPASTPASQPATSPTPTAVSPSPTTTAPTPSPTAESPTLSPSLRVTPPDGPVSSKDEVIQDSVDAQITITDVAFGTVDSLDYLIFFYEGDGAPGFYAAYVDELVHPGSGETVNLGTPATLQLVISGVVPPVGDLTYQQSQVVGLPTIQSYDVYSPWYEGGAEIGIGLSSQAPFTVYLQAEPKAIVVAVAAPIP